jgi:ABC-type Fe3+ transport system permease subunit
MRSPLVGLAAGAPLSLDEFIITYFLIGGHDTLPIYIYTQVKFGITPEVNAVAAMLLAASLAILGLAFALPQLLRVSQRALSFERRVSHPERLTKRLSYPSRAPRSVASIPPKVEP